MVVGACRVYLTIEWANSLKDKRQVVKSIIDRMKNKFNISVAEVESNDNHKLGVVGFCCVSNSKAHIESILQNVVNFVENNTDAVVVDIITEIL